LIFYQKFADRLNFHLHCGEYVLDLCKFQSSQKAAIYAQSVDSANAFKNLMLLTASLYAIKKLFSSR